MKKTLGLTAAVLTLGLAACTSSYTAPKAPDVMKKEEASSAMVKEASSAMVKEASSAMAK